VSTRTSHQSAQSFTFVVTPDSHYAATRALIRRTIGRKVLRGSVLVPPAIVVTSAALTQQTIVDALWSQAVWIVTPAIFILLVLPWLERRQIVSAHKTTPSLGGEQRCTYDESGIRMSGPMSNVDLQWRAVTHVVETADFFLFYFSKNCAHFLPQNVIGSEGEREQLRTLVTAQVPGRFKIERKTPRGSAA
jgi:hypothetical protein